MEYVLIIAMWAGSLSSGDSAALVAIPGFIDEEMCHTAGKRAVHEFSTIYKKVRYVCTPHVKYREYDLRQWNPATQQWEIPNNNGQ